MKLLSKIRKILESKADEKVKRNIKKFIPTVKRSYGVRLTVLNDLANRFKNADFKLIEKLWNSGVFEEQILAAKILGKICKKEPERTINFIKNNIDGIKDWAVCDTLAIQGVRKIAGTKQKEILELSRKLVKSKNLWQRRFGIVLLINFKKERKLRGQIKEIPKIVKNEKEYYVKKAISWLEKEIRL